MLKTHLTQEHGLNLPFVSADMGFIALPELMAAFSNAGGLGVLCVTVTPPPALKTRIDRIRSRLSSFRRRPHLWEHGDGSGLDRAIHLRSMRRGERQARLRCVLFQALRALFAPMHCA